MPLPEPYLRHLNRQHPRHTRSAETNTQANIGGDLDMGELIELIKAVQLLQGKVVLSAGALQVRVA